MSRGYDNAHGVQLDEDSSSHRQTTEDHEQQESCCERIPSFGELYMYLVALLCGISMMMPVNAVFSAPSYMLDYYKYAMNDEFAVPANTNFWDNVLTYYNLISICTALILEPLTLTPQFRRIPMIVRLLSGLCILIVEIILLMVVPAAGTNESGAVITICFAGFIGGTGKSVFESTVYGMLGAFPPSYMSTMMGGVGISGILTSLIQIIVKAALPEDFESVKLQSKIYYGLDVGIQGCTFICLILLRFNGVARQYFGDLGGGKSKTQSSVTAAADAVPPQTDPVEPATLVLHDDVNKVDAEGDAHDDVAQVAAEDPSSSNALLVSTNIFAVMRKIMWMAIACAFNFGITLMLFPTIVVTADTADYWYGTIAVFLFNALDMIGRFTPTLKITWPKTYGQRWIIVAASFARVIFVPLLLVYSYHYIKGHAFGYIMMVIVGYSNGYIGSMCLVLAPKSKGIVGDGERFVAGTLTGISILVGAAIGTALSIMIQSVRES